MYRETFSCTLISVSQVEQEEVRSAPKGECVCSFLVIPFPPRIGNVSALVERNGILPKLHTSGILDRTPFLMGGIAVGPVRHRQEEKQMRLFPTPARVGGRG